MSDPLLDELLARPVGPQSAANKSADPKDFANKIEVSGHSLTATICDKRGVVNEGRALKYIEDEGQDPSKWEVATWYKVEYGPILPVLDADGEPVLDELGVAITKPSMESVRFSFKRRNEAEADNQLSDEVVAGWRERLQITHLAPPQASPQGNGIYSIKIADPQFGKKRTDEAVENYKRGVLGHLEAAKSLSAQVAGLHLAWMGDETENVVNSYENQPHTIELNRTQQLELDYDMRVWTIKEALELGLPISASSVISNHGEWTRNGGKDPVTTQGDNASTYIAKQTKALFDELEPFTGHQIAWHIGGGDPGVTINLGGVDCYFSHGYIEKGKGSSTELRTKAAVERQILGKTEELGGVSLWFMAHYHHFYSNEFEGRSLFGCPAIEAERSSEYMLNQFGVWSPPGVLGMLITDRRSRGWSHLNIF